MYMYNFYAIHALKLFVWQHDCPCVIQCSTAQLFVHEQVELVQNRNGLTGVSFLAGVVSIMAQKILAILLDMEQQDTIRAFAVCFSPSFTRSLNTEVGMQPSWVLQCSAAGNS